MAKVFPPLDMGGVYGAGFLDGIATKFGITKEDLSTYQVRIENYSEGHAHNYIELSMWWGKVALLLPWDYQGGELVKPLNSYIDAVYSKDTDVRIGGPAHATVVPRSKIQISAVPVTSVDVSWDYAKAQSPKMEVTLYRAQAIGWHCPVTGDKVMIRVMVHDSVPEEAIMQMVGDTFREKPLLVFTFKEWNSILMEIVE